MKKPSRRSLVSPGLRKEWLRRVEEGESAPQIAGSDGWDVRTVRKQLELAQQEREVREARHVVLRQALHDHYADLCAFAEKLDSEFAKGFNHIFFITDREARMDQALRQHVPKSPIWRGLEKWEELVGQLESRLSQLRKGAVKRAEERLPLKLRGPEGEIDSLKGFTNSLVFHLQCLAKGWKGLEDTPYVPRQVEGGQTQIQHGAFSWLVPNNVATDVEKHHSDLKTEGTNWEEYNEVHGCLESLTQLRNDLRDELAVLILKRVIPGRCVYCPF